MTPFILALALFGGLFAAVIAALELGRRAGRIAFANDDRARPAGLSTVDLREMFRKYTDSRIALYKTFSQSGVETAHAEYARSVALQNQIWAAAVAGCREVPSATVVVLPALNAMFDVASTRLAATRMHWA